MTGRTASLPRLIQGLRREEEELFAELYQPLVAGPAKQEELLKLCPWPIRAFYRTEHCPLSTASGGAAHRFHTPPAPKNKHFLETLQLQPVPVPNRLRSRWSRLRAPLEGCAKSQSHITVCHTEKGESALPG